MRDRAVCRFIRCLFILAALPTVALAADPAATQAPQADAATAIQYGEQYLAGGQLDPAEAWIREALRLSPNNARALYDLGLILLRRGNDVEAQAQFRAAVTADPFLAYGWLALGDVALRRGDAPVATWAYATYVQVAPSDPSGHFLLGESLRASNKVQDAIAAYQTFISRETRPDQQPRVEEAKRRVAELQRPAAPAIAALPPPPIAPAQPPAGPPPAAATQPDAIAMAPPPFVPGPGAAAGTAAGTTTAAAATDPAVTATYRADASNGRRTLAYVLLGAGIATAAGSGVLFFNAHSAAGEAKQQSQNAAELATRGRSIETFNNVGLVAGGVAAVATAAGAFFYFSSGERASVAVAPSASPGAGGLVVHGVFE